MSNTLLDSIPDEIINKVERCAQEGKSMWFVGGTEDQKKALFEIAHLERYNRDTFQIPSGEILPINIESVAPSRVIDCLSLEGFDCSTCDNVGLSILVQNNKKKEELIVKELDSYLNPPSMLQDNKVTHIHSVVKTLFFNNIPWFGTIILTKLKAIKDKMERWEAGGINKILIVSFLDEIPDGCQAKLREWFEEILLSPEPITEVNQQETKDEQIAPVNSYVFQEEDEFYFIRYESESFRLQKSDGLRYLHYLMMDSKTDRMKKTKKTQLTPKRLYEAIKKVPKLPEAEGVGGVVEAWDKGDLTIESQGDYANLLDKETKEKIKRLEDEIYIAEETRNETKAESLRSELRDFQQEYVRGKQIKFPSSLHKKPYDTINKALNRVVKKIARKSNEKGYKEMITWKHFSNSIQFSDSCFFYRSEKPVNWEF